MGSYIEHVWPGKKHPLERHGNTFYLRSSVCAAVATSDDMETDPTARGSSDPHSTPGFTVSPSDHGELKYPDGGIGLQGSNAERMRRSFLRPWIQALQALNRKEFDRGAASTP